MGGWWGRHWCGLLTERNHNSRLANPEALGSTSRDNKVVRKAEGRYNRCDMFLPASIIQPFLLLGFPFHRASSSSSYPSFKRGIYRGRKSPLRVAACWPAAKPLKERGGLCVICSTHKMGTGQDCRSNSFLDVCAYPKHCPA